MSIRGTVHRASRKSRPTVKTLRPEKTMTHSLEDEDPERVCLGGRQTS